MATYPTNDAVT